MDSALDAFSVRAAALFESLHEGTASPAFSLHIASREDLQRHKDARTQVQEAEQKEPDPSPMSWKEVAEITASRRDDIDSVLEPSAAQRRAFEDESEYDEFDAQATESIQSGFTNREKELLNKEVQTRFHPLISRVCLQVIEEAANEGHPPRRK